MLKEFREFINRGSVVDLAVGVIVGAAFGKIVNSLVEDIVMPPVGLLLGGVDFSSLFISLSGQSYVSLEEAKAAGAATINYGVFINTVINFVVVALAVFLLVRAVNRLQRKPEASSAEPTTKECPYCLSTISVKATRCPHCTSRLQAV